MQKVPCAMAMLVLVGMLSLSSDMLAQTDTDKAPTEKTYFRVSTPSLIDQKYREFEDRDVGIADYFAESLSDRQTRRLLNGDDRRRLERQGVSHDSHYVFTTDPISGSNMVCFAPRDNEEIKAFFKISPIAGTRIYLMGKVTRRVLTEAGSKSIFLVDRVAIGHMPPVQKKPKEQKAIQFTIEYDVETPNGVVRRRVGRPYKIPKAGTQYEIPDPYTGKILYMTFDF